MTTKKAYLIGSPVAHSLSPKMHNLAFSQLKINAYYEAIDVQNDELQEIIQSFRRENFIGANVTMPHKNNVIKYLDELDITSKLSSSVNTIVPKDDKLIGFSTDGKGFIDSLTTYDVNIKEKKILILGAGGAAKSIIVQAALDEASQIIIAKRKNSSYQDTINFANTVTNTTNCTIKVIDINSSILEASINESDILINATPIGMKENDTSIIPAKYLNHNIIVCDLIYEPNLTPLLKSANDLGCKTINGKYMLLYQGARSFELWTGNKMPIEIVKAKFFS